MHDDVDPTPEGLLGCLQMLAIEAAYLNLRRTYALLQDAISTCQQESHHPLALAIGDRVGVVH